MKVRLFFKKKLMKLPYLIPAFKRLKPGDHNLSPVLRLCSEFEAGLNDLRGKKKKYFNDKGLNTFSSSK